MTENPFKSMEGIMWIQPDGPNTQPFVLGCHMLDSLSHDLGDNSPVYCPDLSGPNKYKPVDLVKNPPSLVDVSISGRLSAVADYLEDIKECPATLFVNMSKFGEKSLFTSWDMTFIVPNFSKTSVDYSDLVGMDTNNVSSQSVDGQGTEIIVVRRMTVNRQSTSQVTAINSIFSCDNVVCQSPFSTKQDKCGTLYAVSDAVSSSAVGTANVLYNSGSGWTAFTNDPFDTDEHISAGLCFALDRDTTRVMVFRGVTDGSNPAELAYTDGGAAGTWTTVNIGSTNGEFISSPKAVYALDRNNIWVGTDVGRIYFSGDAGATWTVQEDAVIHTADWNWIHFIDSNTGYAAGEGDVIAKTTDGGTTWSQVTATGGGNNITAGFVHNARQLFVVDSGGEMYYSNDGGTTWTERSVAGVSGTGSWDDIQFFSELLGFASHRTTAPKSNLYMTRDGGYTWESLTTSTNTGLNKLFVCTAKLVYAVGEVQGSTGMIYKVNP